MQGFNLSILQCLKSLNLSKTEDLPKRKPGRFRMPGMGMGRGWEDIGGGQNFYYYFFIVVWKMNARKMKACVSGDGDKKEGSETS